MNAWPPPKRTMDPREIVTGEVRQPNSLLTYIVRDVDCHGHVLEYDDDEEALHLSSRYLVQCDSLLSRPMWGDQ